MAKGKGKGKGTSGNRSKSTRELAGKGSITFFMGALIQAGYLGEEIPESASEQSRSAMRLRQMAEKLARQTKKFGDEDVSLTAED